MRIHNYYVFKVTFLCLILLNIIGCELHTENRINETFIFETYKDYAFDFSFSVPKSFKKRTYFEPNEQVVFFSSDKVDGLQRITLNIFREKFQENLQEELESLTREIKANTLNYNQLPHEKLTNNQSEAHYFSMSEVKEENDIPNFVYYHLVYEMKNCDVSFYLFTQFDKRMSPKLRIRLINEVFNSFGCISPEVKNINKDLDNNIQHFDSIIKNSTNRINKLMENKESDFENFTIYSSQMTTRIIIEEYEED